MICYKRNCVRYTSCISDKEKKVMKACVSNSHDQFETKDEFIERTVLRLNRIHEADELVKYYIKKVSEKDVQIGILNGEIQELKDLISEAEKMHQAKHEATKETRKEDMYKNVLIRNKKLHERNKQLMCKNNTLIAKIVQLEKININKIDN